MAAAQLDIPVLRTELLSQHGQEALEERPADYLIATTGDGIYNGMICGHLAPAMGRERVFQISPGVARLDFYHGLSRDSRGKVLGEPAWNYTLFDTLFEQGWRFVSRAANEANAAGFGADDNRLDILVSRRSAILIRSAEDPTVITPMPGDLMISMVPPTDTSHTEEEAV